MAGCWEIHNNRRENEVAYLYLCMPTPQRTVATKAEMQEHSRTESGKASAKDTRKKIKETLILKLNEFDVSTAIHGLHQITHE